jgi:hypothetical protein
VGESNATAELNFLTGSSDYRTLSAMTKRKAAAETSPDSVAELQATVTELRDEIRTLASVIDEFRADFTHCLRNLPDNLPPPYAHLGTMFEAFSNDPRSPRPDETDAEPERPAETLPVAEKTAPVVAPPELPKPVPAAPAKTPLPPAAVVRRSARPKKSKQPLSVRMVFVPLMTEVVRFTGYLCWRKNELKQRLLPLCEKYGPEAVEAAAQELLTCDADNQWRLNDEELHHASQILGKREI